ncbi:hypothetical protein RO3G_17414 [Rhizopus delemar RA 99-880]|uniref:Uncharacterized protein n=1 Tax=Rhizopus delemar (strain RA 99-880 / ATCC MYA-4621 / FGSC 9543 / NRRL 43880) TaxID=246409 RepID=I1CW72_RHIO9|nr:hypothetical protein RO3G_17414 [Rhizopus delemar RA 99-880]|eukprot:EIE92702.1 hypothetical protein RO3G_17414 [Rhizopus delemar RA 99-880]
MSECYNIIKTLQNPIITTGTTIGFVTIRALSCYQREGSNSVSRSAPLQIM